MLARLAGSEADLDRVLSLRARAFGRGPGVSDRDGFDDLCRHVMIETAEGALALCYRVLLLPSGAALGQSYAGGFYDLAPLAFWPGPVAEMGRFCLDPAHADADALRLAWAAMTRIVDGAGAGLMTGCTSFPGTDWRPHRAALALLAAGHLGPAP
ncbi:GNAT family N-acetyltransferase, partial [Xinfangfangia pollutisoli]|uniref:GNAT family N-acetyltransferase n=1 Tax=Xinfangfangia pollutisoli TaxID=2865960 RepID=UPI001CD517C0